MGPGQPAHRVSKGRGGSGFYWGQMGRWLQGTLVVVAITMRLMSGVDVENYPPAPSVGSLLRLVPEG